ncbi:MAG TPA: glycoside hydrolase family 6 protein, partial [Solirubrobacteraceae bacterium]|nr:glycoside hydrolase family 6 protein [Solirubrobacteraceae bacterium]
MNDVVDPSGQLYVNPVSTTAQAAAALSGQQRADAQLLAGFPSASWFTKGTPGEVASAVDALVDGSSAAGAVPVLVAYNVPFRDCAQYSAGGAADTAAYVAWI